MKKRISLFTIAVILLIGILELNGIDVENISFDSIKDKFVSETVKLKEEEIKKVDIVESELMVYYIDVGQADCVLIRNNNENMLIDAGNNEDGEKLVTYIKSLGIKDFKYVVGTHPHEDHIGGLDNIIEEFSIEEILLPNAYTTTKTFEDILTSIEDKNMNFTVPEIDSDLTLGEAKIKVLYTGDNPSDLNDASIVLRLDFGSNSFLFTGDATEKVEKQILNKDLKVDVYKVAHHGSSYSNSDAFLEKVKPTYGIISCGKDNSYGHPHKEVLESLNKRKVKLYRTDELGTVLVVSDGTDIEISNFKTDTNGD
ncbi:MAG: MBL fold metallo-hydrolase [Bacilli bacterium]|nr:MBL fold metallo-hydrolase [Bacilli bacterium]